jgi:hypothetical protein
VLRYGGGPLENAGVGVGSVNLRPGDCMVITPANVAFAYTDGAWHQVGVSPETAVAAAARRAASAPNARFDPSSGQLALIGSR